VNDLMRSGFCVADIYARFHRIDIGRKGFRETVAIDSKTSL